MSNAIVPVVPKRNAVTGAGYPTSLALGELAVNTTTGDVYLGADPGVVQLGVALAAGTYLNLGVGTGSQVAFTIAGGTGTDAGGYLVSVGGVDQPSGWTVASTTLTFSEPPPVGAEVSIRAILKGIGGGGGSPDIGGRAWSAGATYTQGDLVATSQRETWICIQNSNTGNDPATSPTWWAPQPADAVSLQLKAVSTATPIAGQILAWRNNAWTPWGHMFAHNIYWSDDQTLANGSYLWLANFTDAVAANVSFTEGDYNITTNGSGVVSKQETNPWYSDTSDFHRVINLTGTVTQSDEGGGVKAAAFSSSYLSIADNSAFDFGSGDFTIEAFVKPSSVSGESAIISTAYPTDQSGISLNNYNGSGFILAGDGTWIDSTPSSVTSFVAGQWAHVAYVRNGNTFTLYVNGVSDVTFTDSTALNNSNNQILVGGRPLADQYFNGLIANVRVIKGIALYTSNFSVPTTLPTAVSGTQLLLNFGATAVPTV